MGRTVVGFIISFLLLSSKAFTQLNLKAKRDSMATSGKIFVLPQNFYKQNTGFFCKKEDQLQKRTGLNLFFRLGDKGLLDYLERKRRGL